MTNQEFIDFVIRDKKVPYDDTLLTQIWNYFKIAIQDLETRIDFAYNHKTTLFTVLKDNYYISISDDIKYIKTIYDKTNQQELYGDKDTKAFFLMFNSNEKGYPDRYYYDAVDKRLYFSCSLINGNDYVIDYFIYTYNDTTLTSPTATHPLLNENFELLNLTMGLLIERFYSADFNLEAKLKEYLEVNERARQERREYSKTLIRIDNPRY
jgi:lipopolysaccharide export LptBFGC system permease protein LptF